MPPKWIFKWFLRSVKSPRVKINKNKILMKIMMIEFPKVYDPVLQTATFSTLLKMSRFFGDHQIIVVDSVTGNEHISRAIRSITNDLCRFSV